MKRVLGGLGLGVSMLLPMAAMADPVPDNGLDTQADIVVTGRGLDTQPETRGYDVATIDRQRITATASDRLEDVLGDVAGLQSFRRSDSRSANPTSQGLTLRGIGGNAASRALLILDGVPQGDPFAGWIAFPAYSPNELGAIRVVRGGGSGLWGPGAVTGTVELQSATPDQLDPLTLGLAYGSRNSVDASADGTFKTTGGFATISTQYQRGDGFIPIVAGQRGPVDRQAPYEQASVSLRGVIAVAPDVELQTAVRGFTDTRDRGVDFTANSSKGADASVRLVGSGRWGWSVLGYVQARQFASQFASINTPRTTATLTLNQYNVPATGLGGRVEVIPPLGGDVVLRIGGDVRDTSGRTQELFTYVNGNPTRRRDAGGDTRTAGAFANLTVPLGALTVDLNGRIDSWSISGGHLFETVIATGVRATNSAYADRSGWEPTGRLGLDWRASNALTLRAAGYRGWRLPTLNELYRPFRAGADGTGANPLLNPERLVGGEVGGDLKLANWLKFSATGFINRLDDAIANITIARGPINCPGVGTVSAAGTCRQRGNLKAIEAKGVEAELAATAGAVSMRLSYAYTDARVSGAGTSLALDGLVPAQTPSHQFSATLGWASHGGTTAALTGRYVAGQFEDDQNSRTLREAFTLDGTFVLPLARAVSLELRGENLFDATVDTGFSNASLERSHPRTLWVGVKLRPFGRASGR